MSIIHKFQDKSYKELFSHPKMIQNLMEGFVGEDFIKDIDFEELEKVNVTFIAESYKEREEDLIVKLRFKEQEVYLYILISFQSSPDKFMALRSLTYMLLFYQDLVKQKRIKDLLPMVFPIVLYTGKEKYNSAVKIEDLIYKPYPNLMKYIPKYEYFKVEVTPKDKEKYKKLAETSNIAAACFDLVTPKSREDFIKAGKTLFSLIMKEKELANIIYIWIGHLFNKEDIDIKEFVEGGVQMLETLLDDLHEEGIEKGKLEGREEGLQKGIEKRNIEIARNAFKEGLPIQLISKVTSISIEELKKLQEE